MRRLRPRRRSRGSSLQDHPYALFSGCHHAGRSRCCPEHSRHVVAVSTSARTNPSPCSALSSPSTEAAATDAAARQKPGIAAADAGPPRATQAAMEAPPVSSVHRHSMPAAHSVRQARHQRPPPRHGRPRGPEAATRRLRSRWQRGVSWSPSVCHWPRNVSAPRAIGLTSSTSDSSLNKATTSVGDKNRTLCSVRVN